jgi:hypothetical protein
MQNSSRAPSGGKLIPLNAGMLKRCDRRQVEKEIQRIVRSVRFEFLEQEGAIRLLGPDMYYHALDPHLSNALNQVDPAISRKDILSYRSRRDLFDLCFEDSWSGCFIAERLRRGLQDDNLVLIHLDDHTDMMSTLLECSHQDVLVDPTTGQSFDPKKPADWETGIHSGSVSIGCFVTPFFFTNSRTYVRHLNNTANASARHYAVIRKPCSYELIPGKRFAAIQLSEGEEAASAGSYVVSSSCEALLDTLPPGRVVVHVDFDYLINDFNGNPRSGAYVPGPTLFEAGRRKLDRFFEALGARRVNVDRWIIATSPGFCSGCHWSPLLNAFEEKIRSHPTICAASG